MLYTALSQIKRVRSLYAVGTALLQPRALGPIEPVQAILSLNGQEASCRDWENAGFAHHRRYYVGLKQSLLL